MEAHPRAPATRPWLASGGRTPWRAPGGPLAGPWLAPGGPLAGERQLRQRKDAHRQREVGATVNSRRQGQTSTQGRRHAYLVVDGGAYLALTVRLLALTVAPTCEQALSSHCLLTRPYDIKCSWPRRKYTGHETSSMSKPHSAA